MFQSTLSIAGERSNCRTTLCIEYLRFNPRSPSLESEADEAKQNEPEIEVSIHALHRWRAKRLTFAALTPAVEFQSTLSIAGERSFRLRAPRRQIYCFNPRSPSLESEALSQHR